MESYYEINVSKCENPVGRGNNPPRYRHFFATAPRSIKCKHDLRIVLEEFKAKFPEPDYQISATYVKCVGYSVDTSDPNLTVDES
jgi:hypothetical protein